MAAYAAGWTRSISAKRLESDHHHGLQETECDQVTMDYQTHRVMMHGARIRLPVGSSTVSEPV
jgi:hypothetical protein